MPGIYETFPWLDPGYWTGADNPGEWLGGLLGGAVGTGAGKAGGLFGDNPKTGTTGGAAGGPPVFMIGIGLGLVLLVIIIISMRK